MHSSRKEPSDPIAFVRRCLATGEVFWTYHVNMRLRGRHIDRRELVSALETLELVESYPGDKYFPSYLLLGRSTVGPFHLLCAADVDGSNVRVITAYRPSSNEWGADLKTRRGS